MPRLSPRSRPSLSRLPWMALALVLLSGCYGVRSRLLETPTPAEDLFRCVQLELGRAGYAIVGADRASGWLHAQRRVQKLLSVERAEIYATVIADEASGGSHLQLTDNTHAEDDAERLQAACVPEATPGTG